MNQSALVLELEREFHTYQKLLTSLGDEVRQKLLFLMLTENRTWVRVVDLAEKTSLTRPAVSHHMQILRDAGIILCRKKGKYTYYSFDCECTMITMLIELLEKAKCIIQENAAQNEESLFEKGR